MLVTVRIVKHKAGSAKSGINGVMHRKVSKDQGWKWIRSPKIRRLSNENYDELSFEANLNEAKDYILGYLKASPYWYTGSS